MKTHPDYLGASFSLWGGSYYFEGMNTFIQELKPSFYPGLKTEMDRILKANQAQHRPTRDQLWKVFEELALQPSEYPQIEYFDMDKSTSIPDGALS